MPRSKFSSFAGNADTTGLFRPAQRRSARNERAVDDDGAVVVVWAEKKEGNWDLYGRTYAPAKRSWSEPKRLTRNAGTDTHPALNDFRELDHPAIVSQRTVGTT